MKYAVVYNHSLTTTFRQYADELCAEFKKRDCEVKAFSNVELGYLKDNEIDFEKCVFFDKDILQGLRLERLGVRLFNNIGAIESCDDKRRCNDLIKYDFKTPKTINFPLLFNLPNGFAEEFADRIEAAFPYPCVVKPAFGSWGMGVTLLNNRTELLDYIEQNKRLPHLYCEFISESRGKDVRVYVVGDKIEGSMLRENKNDFRSNIALGGKGTPYCIDEKTASVCKEAARCLSLDFCGIDLLFSNSGDMYICEINSNAMFGELNRVCGTNVAADIVDRVITSRSFDGAIFV